MSIATVEVQLDQAAIMRIYREKIAEAIKEVDGELVYWDRQELMRRTCMSWNFIQEQFFFHPEFPRYKIGNKWYFPARQTRDFLEQWLEKQGR